MKISAKARYALRILLDIAQHVGDESPRTLSAICEAQRLSGKFVSRIVIPLRKAGLVRSVRGVAGGFCLSRAPEDITLLEVVELSQGPIAVLNCLEDEAGCELAPRCPARSVWSDVNTAFRDVLSRVTLATLLKGGAMPSEYCI